MRFSTTLNAAAALCLSGSVESFTAAPLPTRQQCRYSSSSDQLASSHGYSPRSHMIPVPGSTTASKTLTMMAGFGAKKKETPPTPGAGKGQRVYERQMRSFNGLRGAGAEGVDVYVHRKGEDKFIFMGKAAWSSGISVERALQWQKSLILDHVKLLEPSWRTNPAPMRVFTAPLNSEVEVARNMHDLTWVLGGKGKGAVNVDGMLSTEVGLKPELYQRGEDYFYVRKLDDGRSPSPPSKVMMDSMDNLVAAGVIPGAPDAAGGAGAAGAGGGGALLLRQLNDWGGYWMTFNRSSYIDG